MGKRDTSRLQPLKGRREKRAAKAARTGDTPEKLAERGRRGERPSPKDVAERVGLGGFVGGF